MRRLRVLHVYRTYYPDPPGGLQEAIRQIAFATKAHGFDSQIYTLSKKPVPIVCRRSEGVVIRSRSWIELASCDLGGVGAFALFSKLAKRADIIHYHFPWPFADLLHMLVRSTAPAVMTYHSDIIRQRWLGALYAPLMHHTLSKMAAVVATSPAYAQTSPILVDNKLKERVHIIPLGIDEHTYSQQADENILSRLGLKDKEVFFLFIGVLRYYKGLLTLMHAATEVGVNVVIAGTGPQANELNKWIADLKLKNVLLAGRVSDAEKTALLRRCHALVMPSHLRSEAFGMALVEAAMFGKPMISCEIGTGTSFVNINGQTGFVVPPENPRALAVAMNIMLSDKVLAREFGVAARIRYEKYFSGSSMGQAYADLYRNAL